MVASSASMPLHTAVTATLNMAGVTYEVLWQSQATQSITDTAAARGILPARMLKTLLLRDMGNQYALACVPGDCQVDPRRVREQLACRRMTLADADKVRAMTGYTLGTVAPLGLPRPLPIVFEERIFDHESVTISSGDPHAGLWVKVTDLVALCQPLRAAICRDDNP
ncbi:aminoacyl-tRNA deacylase [Salinivibrio sp. PR5]|uniref:aminoacyl-tRNA deacylase n=1 Tax=Salinivibrio sp. PR5 TaxID=1909484 RepID=UPI001F529C02|nr:YbaK/EbsC family protein [Salinivibrio sp. PR5]